MNDTKVYYSVADVARRFGVSDGMIYRLCETGRLGYLKMGASIRISDNDIRMFEKKNHFLPAREKPF